MIKTSLTNKPSSWRTRVLSVGLVLSLLAPLTLLLVSSTVPTAEASPGPGWWNSNWIYRKEIVIDHTKVDGNLDNFPVLISITDADLAADAQDDGDDIAFTDNNGTQLCHEIENFNGSNGTLIAWVRVPTLHDNENTVIYMYYGNPSASNQENAEGVWDGDFMMVQHLQETSGTHYDSTSNNKDAAPNGTPIQDVAGKIDGGLEFEKVNNEYIKTSTNLDTSNQFTIELWANLTNTGNYQTVFYQGKSGSWQELITISSSGNLSSWFEGGTYGLDTTYDWSFGSWHYVTIVYDGNAVTVYEDGSAATSPVTTQYNAADPQYWHTGDRDDANQPLDGGIDEYRFSTTARSAAWIKTSYNNQDIPSTFYSVGSEEVAIPSQPQLQQPGNNSSTNDNTPTFQWSVGQNADNHRLIVDNDPNFADEDNWIDIILGAATDTYTTPADNSLADGKWYWKVVAINPQGDNSSDVWNLIVDKTPPLAPSLSSPENNDNTDDNQVTFTWTATTDNTSNTSEVSNIAHYELWVDDDLDFSSPLLTENTSDNSILSLTREVAGGLYWCVRAWDRAGNPGTFSEIRPLTVFSFSLSTGSTSLTVLRGNAGAAGLSIDLVFGDPENVDLSYTWEGMGPTGITPSFDPPSDTVPFSSTLTFQTSSDASTGEFTCHVTATSESGITRSVDISIQVAGMSFFVLASPTSISLIRSDDAASTISVKFMMGTKENVELSGSWLGSAPTGVSATLDPTNSCPSYDSTLTFATTKKASAGSFTYRVTGTGGGLTQWVDLTVDISTSITTTLTTDKESYEKGQQIQISGTAVDPRGNPVESGTATITLRCGGWSDQLSAQIADGAYADNYFIVFDRPDGDWLISVNAVDNRGNLSQTQENTNISVSTPVSWRYYTVTFLSPAPSTVYSRGSEVTVTVQITGSPEKVKGADVYLATPSGEIMTLTEGSPGIYSTMYVPGWDDPLGEWAVSVLGEKTVQGTYKAGTGSTSIDIAPASLQLELLEPSQRTFEIGKKVDMKVKVSYPDGSPVSEAIVAAGLPNGENLTLLNEGEGTYTGTYSVDSKDLGAWGLTVSAVDAYGNSGASSEATLSVKELSPSSYPIRYWWITIPVALACTLVPLPIVIKKLRIRKLKSIKREISATKKLRKELPKRYFVKGAIPRETYDSLMHQTMEKLMKLKKEARKLKKRLKKR
jgi:hypothetical protein